MSKKDEYYTSDLSVNLVAAIPVFGKKRPIHHIWQQKGQHQIYIQDFGCRMHRCILKLCLR